MVTVTLVLCEVAEGTETLVVRTPEDGEFVAGQIRRGLGIPVTVSTERMTLRALRKLLKHQGSELEAAARRFGLE